MTPTTDAPKEPGLYFATDWDNYRQCVCVLELEDQPGDFVVQVHGDDELFRTEDFCDWSGPITEQDAALLSEAVGLVEECRIALTFGMAGYKPGFTTYSKMETAQAKAREFIRKVKSGPAEEKEA